VSTGPADAADALDAVVVDPVLVSLIGVLDAAGRDDLAARIRAARVRIARPAAVVCVVGEFKQGKSSLVNAFVGAQVCPVDDDIATAALTLVRHGDETGAVVRLTVDGVPEVRQIGIDEVSSYVTEGSRSSRGLAAGPRSGSDSSSGVVTVDRVDVRIPSGALADGLVLVDTPGAGGMSAGHGAATLGFLPFADGLVFVTDLTSELSEPEAAFLRAARERCPHVLVVETKADLFPSWRRIHDLNTSHLERLGLDVEVLPVSTVLADVGAARADTTLVERSGMPALRSSLSTRVIEPAKAGATERARAEAVGADRAAHAVAHLEQLRGPGSRWQIVLGDRVSDLTNDITHSLRSAMRELSRQMDDDIETLRTGEEWDAMSANLQAAVTDIVGRAFGQVESGRREIRDDLADLIAHDDLVTIPVQPGGATIDVLGMWRGKALDEQASAGKVLRSGLNSLRGAQGGVMMFGLGGQFLPHAAAVFMMSNPVLLAAGALFGGMHVFDERKRKMQARRQAARTQMRQFVDDVQFAVGNELTNQLRSVQRGLRDEFSDLIGELQRTWSDTAKRTEEARRATADQIATRRAELERAAEQLSSLRRELEPAR
jgi:hypothetical protein